MEFILRGAPTNNPLVLAVLLVLCCLMIWQVQVSVLEYFLAANGSSPLHWIHLSLDADRSTIDWPTGTRNLGNSFIINIYSFLYDHFLIDPMSTLTVMMGIEILLVSFAFVFFGRTIFRESNHTLVYLFAVLVALTTFQFMNLARFGYPFYWGLYYGFAAAMRIAGIAFVLRNQPWPAAICLSISVMTHPIIGAIGGLVAAVIVAMRGFRVLKRFIIPTVFAVGATVGWLLLNYSNMTIGNSSIPVSDWHSLASLFNTHFYPINFGVFDIWLGQQHFTPLLSLLILYAMFEFTGENRSSFSNEIWVIVIFLLVLTAVGIILSTLMLPPLLVKLCLHRASDLLAVFLLVGVFPALWHKVVDGHFVEKLLVLAIILSPVFSLDLSDSSSRGPGFPMFLTLVITIPQLEFVLRSRSMIRKLGASLFWYGGVFVFLWFHLQIGLSEDSQVFTWKSYLNMDFVAIILISSLALILSFSVSKALAAFALPIIAMVFAINNHFTKLEGYNARSYGDFYEMQQWAAGNTPSTSLFMLDPGISGAWRDHSRRASFGNVNEWLHKSWLYDSNPMIYQEGRRRFSLLALNVEDFLDYDVRKVAVEQINKRATEQYNSMDATWFISMADAEGIDYFVYDNTKFQPSKLPFEIVYKNKRFTVLKP